MLQQVVGELHQRSIQVALARLEAERAQRAAARTGLIAVLGSDHVFRSVDDAIRAGSSTGQAGQRSTEN
jgi:hypothetical protein